MTADGWALLEESAAHRRALLEHVQQKVKSSRQLTFNSLGDVQSLLEADCPQCQVVRLLRFGSAALQGLASRVERGRLFKRSALRS